LGDIFIFATVAGYDYHFDKPGRESSPDPIIQSLTKASAVTPFRLKREDWKMGKSYDTGSSGKADTIVTSANGCQT